MIVRRTTVDCGANSSDPRPRAEIGTLCALLRWPDRQLVTLHGTGGVGKTRLALQTAHALCDDFADGCYWVELAPLQAPSQIADAIAQSLELHKNTGHDPLQLLKSHLHNKAILLVLDNYEHLLDGAQLVADLLRSTERVKCLVTSREPLHLQGEQEVALDPLPLPTADQAQAPDGATDYAAIQLFVQRAQAVNAAFALDPSNTNTVAAICAQVDGLPLAIELAAARCKYFTPTHLLQKLESAKLTFLQGARDMPERHQTLHDAIAWSYDLLNSAERQLFRRLAIFVGGCTLEAVEQVCQLADDALAGCLEDCREDWLETLISLVDKNLIRQEIRTDGESKYLLLETLRAFATARLDESNDRWVLQQAHAEYYFELVNMNWPTAYWMTR